MDITRIQFKIDGTIIYRLGSDYAKDSIAITPKELMELHTWLNEHEQEIIQDSISNLTTEASS